MDNADNMFKRNNTWTPENFASNIWIIVIPKKKKNTACKSLSSNNVKWKILSWCRWTTICLKIGQVYVNSLILLSITIISIRLY